MNFDSMNFNFYLQVVGENSWKYTAANDCIKVLMTMCFGHPSYR